MCLKLYYHTFYDNYEVIFETIPIQMFIKKMPIKIKNIIYKSVLTTTDLLLTFIIIYYTYSLINKL